MNKTRTQAARSSGWPEVNPLGRTSMPWSRITFPQGFESPECRWVRTVFQQLYIHAPDQEFDALALYRNTGTDGVTLYLSPRGTARLTVGSGMWEYRQKGNYSFRSST